MSHIIDFIIFYRFRKIKENRLFSISYKILHPYLCKKLPFYKKGSF